MGAEGRIEVIVGDVTRLDVDAVVNAAHRALAGGVGAGAYRSRCRLALP